MKLGLELISYVSNSERVDLVTRSLNSLIKTNVTGLEQPVLLITYHPGTFDYSPFFKQLEEKFELHVREDPPDVHGASATYINSVYYMLEFLGQSITHVGCYWDDFIYNPEWLIQLASLIGRHPDGIAWSVYRSRYTRHHRIVGGDGTDVLMSMHDGVGTLTREEWMEYKKQHNGVDFSVPFDWPGGGCTPDIHHSYARPGNRWTTSKDYCENIGRHVGIESVDCAINFVGE